MLVHGDSPGFTLVELMVAMAVLAILLVMGVPSFTIYLANSRIRATAESFFGGVQMARGQAVSKNAQVEFVLTSDPNAAAGTSGGVDVANTVAASATGSGWLVRFGTNCAGACVYIEGKSAAEGAGGSGGTPAVQVSGTLADGTPVSSVLFNGFGATTLNQTATFAFQNQNGGACAPAGQMRCLNVAVSIGGQARMCDPAVTTVGDTRKC